MQNSKGNEDLRIRRTRKLLQASLMELTIQKGFESVTVMDICERAMVNRATFYRHYTDKYNLLDQYMEELYLLLEQPAVEPEASGAAALPGGLVQMLEHLRNHADFYRIMLGPKGYPAFGERIRFYMEKRFRHSLSTIPAANKPGRPPFEMMLRCVSNAALGAIVWWLENDTLISPEQMAAWALQLSSALFYSS